MELKDLHQQWESFPEVSMEERPMLSSDLEKIVVKNPLSDAFYLKNKILPRIIAGAALLLYNIYQLRELYRAGGGPDVDMQVILFLLLSYFVYFHTRLLLFADYPALLALPLIPFLSKIETILDKYIYSFGVSSILSGFYSLVLFEKVWCWTNSGAYPSIHENGVYKWLIIIFLSVSFYIFFLHTIIPKYKKLLTAVRKYKEGIGVRPQKK